MKRVLIVSPHFPPTNAPDHQRVRMSLPYFADFGWEPTILAVAAGRVEAPIDPRLAATVPPTIAVHRVEAFSPRWTRRVGLGNVAYRAWLQLAAAGARLLSQTSFDLVYFSTTQFVATALGPRWLKRFGVPYVIDIQDPWRTDYYERPGAPPPPGGWKYRFARWQAARLEERAWRDAAGFISVNDEYLAQLRARYAWFASRPTAVIPFGAPEIDFDWSAKQPDLSAAFAREPGLLHLVSVGAVGPIMRDALTCLFAAVRDLRQSDPSLAARLRFDFIGTSYAPPDRAIQSVLPVAAEFGVGDLVREQPVRVGYFTAIKTMLAADAIIIPGSNDPAYNPSKIAACFLADKPTLALAPAQSAFAKMVREISFATLAPTDRDNLSVILNFFRTLAGPLGPTSALVRNQALFAATYTARARTAQQCALFERALALH